jgi:hypothetical protein
MYHAIESAIPSIVVNGILYVWDSSRAEWVPQTPKGWDRSYMER